MPVSPRTVVVAVNPMASFGRRRDVGPRVVERLRAAGHTAVAVDEANIELLRRETARAVAAGADALVVVGGDGMANLGINIVVQTEIPLGIVPSGTGNDLADGLGIPTDDSEAAIDLLLAALQRRPRVIDAGLVRHGELHAELTTWFGCVLSAGFDATVNERANLMTRPRGRSRYVFARPCMPAPTGSWSTANSLRRTRCWYPSPTTAPWAAGCASCRTPNSTTAGSTSSS